MSPFVDYQPDDASGGVYLMRDDGTRLLFPSDMPTVQQVIADLDQRRGLPPDALAMEGGLMTAPERRAMGAAQREQMQQLRPPAPPLKASEQGPSLVVPGRLSDEALRSLKTGQAPPRPVGPDVPGPPVPAAPGIEKRFEGAIRGDVRAPAAQFYRGEVSTLAPKPAAPAAPGPSEPQAGPPQMSAAEQAVWNELNRRPSPVRMISKGGEMVPVRQKIEQKVLDPDAQPFIEEEVEKARLAREKAIGLEQQAGEIEQAAYQRKLMQEQAMMQVFQERQAQLERRRAATMREAQADLESRQADLDNTKIESWFDKAPVGAKIMAGIGLMLSEFAAVSQRTRNTTLDMIMEHVNNDLAVQKANLERKERGFARQHGIVAEMRARYEDKRLADLAAEATTYRRIEQEMQKAASLAASPRAQAQLQEAMAKLHDMAAQRAEQFAVRAVEVTKAMTQPVYSGGGGLTPSQRINAALDLMKIQKEKGAGDPNKIGGPVDQAVETYQKALDKAGATELDIAADRIERTLLDKNGQLKKDVPGVGLVASRVPVTSQEAKDNQANLKAAQAAYRLYLTGKAQSVKEMEEVEAIVSGLKTPESYLNAARHMRKDLAIIQKNAGVRPEIAAEYARRAAAQAQPTAPTTKSAVETFRKAR